MLFIDTVWYDVVLIAVTSVLGMVGVGTALSGYFLAEMNPVERILAIAGGILCIIPGIVTDLCGIAVLALVVLFQVMKKKKAAA